MLPGLGGGVGGGGRRVVRGGGVGPAIQHLAAFRRRPRPLRCAETRLEQCGSGYSEAALCAGFAPVVLQCGLTPSGTGGGAGGSQGGSLALGTTGVAALVGGLLSLLVAVGIANWVAQRRRRRDPNLWPQASFRGHSKVKPLGAHGHRVAPESSASESAAVSQLPGVDGEVDIDGDSYLDEEQEVTFSRQQSAAATAAGTPCVITVQQTLRLPSAFQPHPRTGDSHPLHLPPLHPPRPSAARGPPFTFVVHPQPHQQSHPHSHPPFQPQAHPLALL